MKNSAPGSQHVLSRLMFCIKWNYVHLGKSHNIGIGFLINLSLRNHADSIQLATLWFSSLCVNLSSAALCVVHWRVTQGLLYEITPQDS